MEITGGDCTWGDSETLEVAVICDPSAGVGKLEETMDYDLCTTYLKWKSLYGVRF